MTPAVDSYRMAELFRDHDIYLTASKNDPCSNSMIETLTYGLWGVAIENMFRFLKHGLQSLLFVQSGQNTIVAVGAGLLAICSWRAIKSKQSLA